MWSGISYFSLNNNIPNMKINNTNFDSYIKSFFLVKNTISKEVYIANHRCNSFINEFWTSKQRQSSSIHEISYRACFKPELPNFFVKTFTKKGDLVYDPFSGRGTTLIEAALLGRNIVSNDINPISEILSRPRLLPSTISDVKDRLDSIPLIKKAKAEIDLSMFFHEDTEAEIVSLKKYLSERKISKKEDNIDRWIRMVATNRLTGHSKGFFSVYTLPPNQAASQQSQIKINKKLNQKPEYKDVKKIIIEKSKSLIRKLSEEDISNLYYASKKAVFLNNDARNTKKIDNDSVKLIVTSPPFLDVVQYPQDNWMRLWFNNLDIKEISKKVTMSKDICNWKNVMKDVFIELYRITKSGGWVAFEVGEIKKGKINLEEQVIPLGIAAGFECKGVLINMQKFTKTSNIWGISNNINGTNTNRVIVFRKD